MLTCCLAQQAIASVALDIPPRRQWDNNNGYCGEVAIQQAALFFGTYVSQYRARQIIDPTLQQDVWIPDNSAPVFDTLRLNWVAWDSSKPSPQYQSYLAWTKSHLQQGHPVVIDVFVKGESDPAYDHIMLATGFVSTDASTYHGTDTLTFNDGYETTPYTRTFASLWDTRSMLGNGATYEYCIPRNTDYGCAITGVKDTSGTILPVSLRLDRWNEPNVSQGAAPATLNATVRIGSLTAGQSYTLLRYDDPTKVPTTNYRNSAYQKATHFSASSSTHALADQFLSNSIIIYRCIPATTVVIPRVVIDRVGGRPRIRVTTITGQHYLVQWRSDLTSGPWTNLGTEMAGTGSEISITDTTVAGQPKRFYRVRVTSP